MWPYHMELLYPLGYPIVGLSPLTKRTFHIFKNATIVEPPFQQRNE